MKPIPNYALSAVLALATLAPTTIMATAAQAGPVLTRILERGTLRCGVQGPSNPGFGEPDAQGHWSGFNIDMCRAVASVIFSDASKFEAVPVTPQNRFQMLQSGEADLLTQNTTFTMSRDTQLRLNFPAITFYDAQAIMVPKKLNVSSTKDLNGATICVLPGTTNELNLNDYFQKHGLTFTPVVIDSRDDLFRAYSEGRCDGISSDGTTLAAQRRRLPVPADHVILSEPMSKEPLGIAVMKGDEELRMIASWAFNTLVNAEELGITQANVDQMTSSKDPEVRRLLGVDKGLGVGMGVKDDFGRTLIKEVGNYGEIFERTLGPNTPIGLPRGLNRLWTQGGILYTPPNR